MNTQVGEIGVEGEVEEVDVEVFAREGRAPPPARRYRVRIDGKPYVFEVRLVTGRDILEKAGKTPPERFQLDQRIRGKFEPVGLGETVDLGRPGLEVFETFPLDEREG